LAGALGVSAVVAIGWSLPGDAGTLYRCTGSDGVPAYVSQRIAGAECTTIEYADDSRKTAPATAPEAGARIRPTRDEAAHGESPDHAIVSNFGDPNAAPALAGLRQSDIGFRYVQVGDSHTAADFMTGQLRARLQARLGDGGAGWVTPVRVSGQRLARISFQQSGWGLSSSRTGQPADYPFGGLFASPVAPRAELTLSPSQDPDPDHDSVLQNVSVIIRQDPGDAPLSLSDAAGQRFELRSEVQDGNWHTLEFSASLPLHVVAEGSPGTSLGGWWLSSPERGAVVSAVGINGSQLAHWRRWRSDWMRDLGPARPDVIALAYGTNEAFDDTLDVEATKNDLTLAVSQIRERFPTAAVLIVGAPESLAATAGTCGARAPSLDAVQRIQREVAVSTRTLYWDAQAATGGACSMKQWMREGLARKDGVHFSSQGYARLGDALYAGLVDLAGGSRH
ncbi:MAG TPA: GDSL-type esterase/lipase family protein, partial [Chiayiivirga sp.]|nr:GDSL-type esterase/lipase family protein [Chiayiivirga sp.]